MALRTVGVRLAAEVSGYVNSLRTAKAATKDFATELDKSAKAGKLDAVADSAAKMGLVLAGGFAVAVNAAAKFDKQMSAVGAATHASAGDMERLRQAALQAGKDTSFSATQAAQGIEELAKAGVSTAAILSGGLKGALDLAAAGGLEVGEAAEVAASAMTQFKLSGQAVPHVADLLAAGAGKAQGSVHDLSMALNQGGLVAAQMGLSIEDTTGTLAAFASAGLLGSDAGTSLKTALLMLANPTDKARATMEQYGISVYDASGQFVGITALAGQLQDKLGGLTQEQRNAALATIFGADAIRSASILYEQGAQGIQGWIDKTNDAGFAAETARKKTDNLTGDIERLTGQLETLAIESGSGANQGLRVLVQSADALATQFAELPPVVGSAVTVLAGAAGAALLLGAGWIKARRATAEALDELRKTGPVGTRAARGLEVTTKWAGRATTAFLALEVASAILSATQEDLNPQIEALGKGLAGWGKDGKLAGEAARVLGENMDDLNTGFKFLADTDNSRRQFARWGQDLLETVVPGLDGTNTSLTKTRERVAAFDQALAQLVQGGSADMAAATFERFAASQAAQGVSLDEVKAKFPGYAAALEVAGNAAGGVAGSSKDAAGAIGNVGGAAEDAKQKVDDLKEAFDRLFGIEMDLDRATIDYKKGLVDLKDELTHGKRTLDTNTQAGRDNVEVVLDQIDRIKELRDARIDHGETLDVANGKYLKDIEGLRNTMLQAGYTKAEIDALIGKYKAIPDEAKTEVSAPGAVAAKGKVNDFNFAIGRIPASKSTTFDANTKPAMSELKALKNYIKNFPKYVKVTVEGNVVVTGGGTILRRYGGITEHAQTGLLREASVFTSRSPARFAFAEPATGGEAFIPKFGDFNRSMAVLSRAAQWYGMQVTPAGRPQATFAPTINVYAVAGQSEQAIAMKVSQILGRQADLYARGG